MPICSSRARSSRMRRSLSIQRCASGAWSLVEVFADGFVGDLAGPVPVGAVEAWRVVVAGAVGFAAAGVALVIVPGSTSAMRASRASSVAIWRASARWAGSGFIGSSVAGGGWFPSVSYSRSTGRMSGGLCDAAVEPDAADAADRGRWVIERYAPRSLSAAAAAFAREVVARARSGDARAGEGAVVRRLHGWRASLSGWGSSSSAGVLLDRAR